MKKILIIDDDAYLCEILNDYLSKNGYETESAHSGKEGLKLFIAGTFDLVISNYRLPDMEGMEVLHAVKSRRSEVPVIIVTAYAEIRTVVRVIKSGAFDFVTKPIHQEEILKTIENALKKKAKEESRKMFSKRYIRGRSKRIMEVMDHVAAVGPTDMTVLIQGETGSGKEFIARSIHFASKRKNKPFVPVDCGAIPKELANSELFGHVKGSFTGAISDKIGYFELAKGGTLFLDEVGNLPYENQMKILRALQERVITRVGSNKKIEVDLRIITATNEDLLAEVERHNFREDLYHRINGFKIDLPALRERKEDIMEFTHNFIKNANKEFDKNVEGLDDVVREIFLKYTWYGNIRELENVVKRCVLLAKGPLITPDTLPEEILQHEMLEKREHSILSLPHQVFELKKATNEAEKEAIITALLKTNFNKSKAAKLLNIDRKTLYNKIREYNISILNQEGN